MKTEARLPHVSPFSSRAAPRRLDDQLERHRGHHRRRRRRGSRLGCPRQFRHRLLHRDIFSRCGELASATRTPDSDPEQARNVEYRATRVAALLLLLLAIYIVGDAGRRLLGLGVAAAESIPGIILTTVSLVVMPLLAWAKFSTAVALGSRALRTDAFQTLTCVWLSLATLGGLLLTATLGWTWADPVAALLLLPVVVREGLEGLRRQCD